MVFCEDFSFGRVPNRAIRILFAACKNAASAVSLTHELEMSIRVLMDKVRSFSPLLIQP